MKFPHTHWKRIFSLIGLFVLVFSVSQPTVQADARSQSPAESGPQPIVLRPVRMGISTPHPPQTTPPEEAAAPQPATDVSASALPAPILNFDGLKDTDNMQTFGTQRLVIPPDTNGDIGPSHYIQVVNNLYRISSPTLSTELATETISKIFENFGGLCENNDDGSPIVLYDHLADRWLISQMARDAVAPGFEYHQCVAVSTTPNPVADPWFLYDFQVITPSADLYTAPRLAVWMDGYYLVLDQWKYNPSTGGWNAAGQGAAVLEREKMLLGQNARMIYFNLANSHPQLRYMVPADLDGFPPPLDTPGLFLQVDDTDRGATADQLEIWQLDVTWDTELAAWGKAKDLAVDTFDSKFTCSPTSYDCIPQPGATTDQYLDAVAERLMYRVQYRYMNDAGHLILNHTVDAGSGRAGVRWYHLQTDALQEWTVADQGTYAPPDVHHRWMGSAAMDASGNIAVGYSVASSTLFPSIRYTGRLSTDTPGTMDLGEATVVSGSGLQTDTSSRWGSISSMAVDPVDQCTFWYTNQYVKTSGAKTWETKIVKFDLGAGTCSTPATTTISGTVLDALSGQPIEGATVTTNTGYMAKTGADGIYTLKGLPTDAVTVTANAIGHTEASQPATPPAVDVDFQLARSSDDYNGATVISGIPFLDVSDTTIATSALDDPTVTACGLGAGSATLWYKFTPTATQPVYIDTYASDYDTFIAVWTGARGSLSPVACNDNAGSGEQSALTLSAVKDTEYYIEVGQSTTTAPTGGTLKFHLVTFADVPGNFWAWRYVEGMYDAGITGGCSTSPLKYCPANPVTRDQMAVFLLKAKHGNGYVPPAVGASTGFADVPTNYWAAAWIKQLAAEGITTGCGDGIYCPGKAVARDQMAVFLLRMKHGSSYSPPLATGQFNDVPTNYWAANWIEQLAAEGITGGCGNDNYCPATTVTRDQMAVFLIRAASLPLVP